MNTVEEVISALRKYPPETLVAIAFQDCDGCKFAADIERVTVKTEAEISKLYGTDFGGKDGDLVVLISAFATDN